MLLEIFRNNSKLIWKGINEILNKTTNSSQNGISLQVSESTVEDEKQDADIFNGEFTSVDRNPINDLRKSTTALIRKTQ